MTTWFWSEDVRVLKRMIAVAALALPMLAGAEEIGQVSTAVSYTHLTLPTIYSV